MPPRARAHLDAAVRGSVHLSDGYTHARRRADRADAGRQQPRWPTGSCGWKVTAGGSKHLIRMMMSSPSDKMKKKWSKDSLTLLPCFYFVELPIVASSMVSLYFLELTDVVRPPQVGFRCHDRELSKPYVDGGDEMIPLLMLLSLAFAGPAASIMLVEAFVYFLQTRTKVRRAEGSINAGGCNFNSFLRRTVRFVGVHVFGLCATALVTDVIQLSTGYHAPFFLTVCKPNYTHVACDTNAYITKDICSGHDHHAIAAARKTFPSQHATLSAFAAVYVSMYFNSTISNSTKLLKPVLVFFFAIAAALTGLTQITQHRSHPVDIYVGFLIGAFIAAYLAFHAVANFKSSDIALAPPPPPVLTDPLRALTERGHESVYQKGPASASESNDEIAAAPAPLECRDGAGPLQREVASMGSLKRASVDVELLAPRSPMAKETMLTFSNTLPRASINMGEGAPGPVQQIQPVQLRLKAVHVPMDPVSSQRLLTEWKQKSMEMRSQSTRDENETSEDGSEADDRGSQVPICLSGKTSASGRNRTPPPSGAKAVATPRPPQIPEAGPPPVSPKSSVARAKWQAIREKTGGDTSGRVPANQPRLMQVVAMSKQQGLLGSSSSAEKSSETDSTCSGASSSAAAASPRYRQTPEKQREGIVTVDAHASHHPLAQAPPSERNGRPWEWGGGDLRDTYDLNSLQRGDSAACGSSFRPHRSPGAPHSASPQPQFEVLTDAQRKEMAMRRKTALVLLERDGHHADEDNHFKSFQSRRMKD
ncbi:phospholipid phosphatase-related protein type 3 isoform X1 [Entelurus aequoreus]|uniref:phospholipid phosphatase-related protein type 3 isoform X1 n=1 Tax=Entelurus aequoreus TaxID=161455 RepID=UPI002B1D5962|nr:phospholipid phosphatase-related protein type 3 isoform X1 [Entelurus aequoreus]